LFARSKDVLGRSTAGIATGAVDAIFVTREEHPTTPNKIPAGQYQLQDMLRLVPHPVSPPMLKQPHAKHAHGTSHGVLLSSPVAQGFVVPLQTAPHQGSNPDSPPAGEHALVQHVPGDGRGQLAQGTRQDTPHISLAHGPLQYRGSGSSRSYVRCTVCTRPMHTLLNWMDMANPHNAAVTTRRSHRCTAR
jgi:hypothetical protein